MNKQLLIGICFALLLYSCSNEKTEIAGLSELTHKIYNDVFITPPVNNNNRLYGLVKKSDSILFVKYSPNFKRNVLNIFTLLTINNLPLDSATSLQWEASENAIYLQLSKFNYKKQNISNINYKIIKLDTLGQLIYTIDSTDADLKSIPRGSCPLPRGAFLLVLESRNKENKQIYLFRKYGPEGYFYITDTMKNRPYQKVEFVSTTATGSVVMFASDSINTGTNIIITNPAGDSIFNKVETMRQIKIIKKLGYFDNLTVFSADYSETSTIQTIPIVFAIAPNGNIAWISKEADGFPYYTNCIIQNNNILLSGFITEKYINKPLFSNTIFTNETTKSCIKVLNLSGTQNFYYKNPETETNTNIGILLSNNQYVIFTSYYSTFNFKRTQFYKISDLSLLLNRY